MAIDSDLTILIVIFFTHVIDCFRLSNEITHANRHCPDHPHGSLQRVSAKVAVEDLEKMRDAESNDDVRDWLDRYA